MVWLLTTGKKDGAVKMIKVGSKVEAHQWSVAEQKWSKVGDVVGSSGADPAGGRMLYEGQVPSIALPNIVVEAKAELIVALVFHRHEYSHLIMEFRTPVSVDLVAYVIHIWFLAKFKNIYPIF